MNTSKLLAAAVAGALLAAPLTAQEKDYQALYESKVSESWVTHGNWVLDFEEAKARAKAENKLIFAYFTRSYAP
ncbi:MAG: hypothetical protein MK209_01885 [Planctomycetes bacterium]|nr:hypothetical protein [Planctomycetota bacterium]